MDYKKCPHYDEIVDVLSKGLSLHHASFNIGDIAGCPECEDDEGSVCCLWVGLALAGDLSPQVGINGPEVTIDTLDDRIKEIAWALLNSYLEHNRKL